ncbi:MAG: hypothetical protein KC560_21140 [Myxococcales bacterium]|nr:hypothetical protein [Myxococcales bacterium]
MTTELRKEAFGPEGDPARHLPLDALESGLAALPASPRDAGVLRLVAFRRSDGVRETPARTRLTPGEGVPGDGWARRPPRDPQAQLAVIHHGVAALVANGQPLPHFGDNLYVDLDLSAENLPFGTRLRVGDALVEMTPKPHDGCAKFRQRFGADALRFVQAGPTRPRNLRGVYWRVVEEGAVEVGAPVAVVERPA